MYHIIFWFYLCSPVPSEAVNHGSFVTIFAIANVHGRIIGIGMVCSGEKARRKSTGSRTTVTTKGTEERGHGTLCYPEFLMDTRRSESSDPAPVWWVRRRRRPGWQGQGKVVRVGTHRSVSRFTECHSFARKIDGLMRPAQTTRSQISL